MDSFAKRLEDRLELLIEEKFTRVLPGKGPRAGISRAITAAIQAAHSEQRMAPDLYILVLDPKTAQAFTEDPTINERFSEIILKAGKETGIEFISDPKIKISADPAKKPGCFEVLANFSLQTTDKTRAFTTNSEEGNQAPEFAFLIMHGEQIIPISQQVVNLGRRVDNHIVLEDKRVSRMHAQIRAINKRYVIFDLDSSGGTFVNGTRISQHPLTPGDVISLAGVDLIYGQDAAYLSGGATRPMVPFPDSDDNNKGTQ